MSETTRRQCFFVPGKPGIIDELNLATGRSYIEKENLEEIRLRYPGAEIGDLGDCARRSEKMFLSAPEEITTERWDEMLCVLPPQRWVQERGTSSFELSEHTYGLVTSIYVRIGSRYFSYSGYAGTPHQDKVKRCDWASRITL